MQFPKRIEDSLDLYAGDDAEITFELTYDDDSPVELEEWSDWRCHWRVGMNTFDLGVQVSGSRITLSFSAIHTRSSEGSGGTWDVQSRRNGITRTWLVGSTYTEQDVTL